MYIKIVISTPSIRDAVTRVFHKYLVRVGRFVLKMWGKTRDLQANSVTFKHKTVYPE